MNLSRPRNALSIVLKSRGRHDIASVAASKRLPSHADDYVAG
jgi:hypothetical protein